MICPKCGADVPDWSKFCLECGERIAQSEQADLDVCSDEGDEGPLDRADERLPEGEPLGNDDEWAAVKPISPKGDLVFKPLQYPEPITLKSLRASAPATLEDSITVCEAAGSEDGDEVEMSEIPSGSNEHTVHGLGESQIVGPEAIEGSRKNKRGKFPFVVAGVVAGIVVLCVGISLIAAMNAPYEINMKTFPDEGLRNAILALDDDGDGKIRRDQIPDITHIEVERAVNISGLSMFTNLQSLEAYGDQLVSVDVSDVPSLVSLTVCNSGVKEVNASGLADLQSIDAHNSHLSSINLTGLTSLDTLNLQSTSLGQIDISSCSSLSNLLVSDNVVVSGVENTEILENWTISSFSSGKGANGGGTFVSTEAKYNDAGMISEVVYADADSGANYSYAYNDAGHLVSLDEHPTNESIAGSAYRLSYDDSGKLSGSENATTGETYTYRYDDQNRISGFEAYIYNERNRKEMYERDFSYDGAGNLSEITGDDPATLTYDEAGRLTAYRTHDGVYAYEFSYDGAGRCVEAVITLDGGTCTEKFTYDNSGKMVNATRTLAEGTGRSFPLEEITSSQFTYDAHGNLVSLVMYNDDGQVGWCNFGYKRSFTSKDHAPVGTVPTPTDPLWYNSGTNCLWTPWMFKRQSDESQDALLMVFAKDQVWMGSHNPIFR